MTKTPQQPPQPGPIDVPRSPGQAESDPGIDRGPATPGRNPGSNPDNPGDDPKVREPQRLPDVVATDEPTHPGGRSGAQTPVRS